MWVERDILSMGGALDCRSEGKVEKGGCECDGAGSFSGREGSGLPRVCLLPCRRGR